MRILSYKLFENERPIISYDFDGCLHTSVDGLDPHDFADWDSWIPFTEMHDQMREDAKTHKIVVTTARPPETNEYVQAFLEKFDLPVEEIHATNNWPKTPLLVDIGAVKHYDDNIKLTVPLREAGIEFVLVDPKARTQKLMENETPNPLKNFQITFVNEKFYISDNTIKAFIKRLQKLDPDIQIRPEWGKLKNARVIMTRSAVLDQAGIRALMREFEKNYDWLQMNVVVTRYY
jgi:hypothetical protein